MFFLRLLDKRYGFWLGNCDFVYVVYCKGFFSCCFFWFIGNIFFNGNIWNFSIKCDIYVENVDYVIMLFWKVV